MARPTRRALLAFIVIAAVSSAGLPLAALGQTIVVDGSSAGRRQTIDGFGASPSATESSSAWWQQLFYDDARCTILRVDLTPAFTSVYSANGYDSPAYQSPVSTYNNENGTNTRLYTSALDYTAIFAGIQPKIAVMSADIDANAAYFDLSGTTAAGAAARRGIARQGRLGGFKLIGSIGSPAPWLKVPSGNRMFGFGLTTYKPKDRTPFPFIWMGNFAGGRLDVSGTPLSVFSDGSQATTALTQFARCTAAYVRAFQNKYGVSFHAISIQNEVCFEQYYNSALYPLSSQYIAALKAVRAEFDSYPDLKGIALIGPEDVLGGDAYGMWQFNPDSGAQHKNLQYLQNIAADPAATAALAFYCIHGYAADGIGDQGAVDPAQWNYWLNGWTSSPASAIPPNVAGFGSRGKKSWMTETSQDNPAWLSPATGVPNAGAWSIALKMHHALNSGSESAFLYKELTDGNPVSGVTLTDASQLSASAKYAAFKHFSAFIRPGSVRLNTLVSGAPLLNAGSYINDADNSLVIVLVNGGSSPLSAAIAFSTPAGIVSFQTVTSSNGAYLQPGTVPVSNGAASVNVPGYGVMTLFGLGALGNLQQWRQSMFNDPLGENAGADDADADGDGVQTWMNTHST